MQQRISPWQVLFYVSWSVLALWLILKVTGIIHTPVWLEYGVPIASLLVGILGIYQNVLEQLKNVTVELARVVAKVEHIDRDVETLKRRTVHL